MVITGGVRSDQDSVKVVADCFISLALCAGYDLDAGRRKCFAGMFADAAADQNINILFSQHSGKRSVALAVGGKHDRGDNAVVFHRVHLELFGLSEMLENFSVFVCYCNFHV